MADALAILASMYQVNTWNDIPRIIVRRLDRPAHVFTTEGWQMRNLGIITLSIFFRLGNIRLVLRVKIERH